MPQKLLNLTDKIITGSFYLLFFAIPLILTPYNYELFEYNKMMAVYGATVIITGSWIVKMILKKEVSFARTPLDLPLLLFLISQIVSTVFSIDPHVSLFGYYSRFNGGLLSTIAYLLLYYAFVTNFPKEKIGSLLKTAIASGVLVSAYGVLEHFGIDKDLWVQDVQNRVFSTLGQPNWLAAYLSILIPISLGLGIKAQNAKFKDQNQNLKFKTDIWLFVYLSICLLFYLTLLFTKSRSGFLGIWVALFVFLLLLLKDIFSHTAANKNMSVLKYVSILLGSFALLTFLFGSPIPQINKFTYSTLIQNNHEPETRNPPSSKSYGSSLIDVGITESGIIRRIVWKGAVEIFKAYPIIGTGAETFAFSYYKFRPPEHNMTSEWDFLYNKAHNEYLNFAANSGIFGLGSYLLIIGVFVWWSIKKLKNQSSKIKSFLTLRFGSDFCTLHFALFTGWFSILITNFFGFSVVLIQLFFYLLPAVSFILSESLNHLTLYPFNPLPLSTRERANSHQLSTTNYQLSIFQRFLLIIVFLSFSYLLFTLTKFWVADVLYARGYQLIRSGDFAKSYTPIKQAISLNPGEPLYYDELSFPAAQLALAFYDEGQATVSAQLAYEAVLASNQSVAISPNNVNFYKTRTRVFYTLYGIDEQYLSEAGKSLEKARELSPADPKILYNLALIYDKFEKKEEAVKLLEEATRLKADYRDSYFALGLFYRRDKMMDKAREAFNHILTRINPADEDTKKQLEEIK